MNVIVNTKERTFTFKDVEKVSDKEWRRLCANINPFNSFSATYSKFLHRVVVIPLMISKPIYIRHVISVEFVEGANQ